MVASWRSLITVASLVAAPWLVQVGESRSDGVHAKSCSDDGMCARRFNGAETTGFSESLLLQVHVLREDHNAREKRQHAAWAASPFDDCVRSCGLARRTRKVECRSLFGSQTLPDSDCAALSMPSRHEVCDCTDEACIETPCATSVLDIRSQSEKEHHYEDHQFDLLGCLHDASGLDSGDSVTIAADEQCITWSGTGFCQGGLPFYRVMGNVMTDTMCFHHCVGKALDLFGITSRDECRCGASALNTAVWRDSVPRPSLAFPMDKVVDDDQEKVCPIRVYRYKGHFEGGSIPFELLDATVSDQAYIDSIVLGRTFPAEAEEDVSEKSGLSFAESSQSVHVRRRLDAPGWDRPCFPNHCGPGLGPWKHRMSSLIGGMKGRWKEYTVIPYYFDPALDNNRKMAFRKAVRAWKMDTCIHFAETAKESTRARLWVDAHELEHCYVSHIGYPGDGERTVINLGWCDSDRYVGNIIHELGHVVGMNHEQKRPDAVHEYHGHGPHLEVDWNAVGEEWADQYHPDTDSYVGSMNDGSDDPWAGYASYDFESIMHYPAGSHFKTIPVESGRLTGNRRHLSAGDIRQILDQYQCKENL